MVQTVKTKFTMIGVIIAAVIIGLVVWNQQKKSGSNELVIGISPSFAKPLQVAAEEAKQQGLTEHIGVSNFNIELTQQAIDTIGLEHIATNQIELSPYLQNQRLVSFLQSQKIDVTSYMTLAYGKVLNDPVLQGIAAQHQASTAQIALAWALQKGFAVIPSSTKREHLLANLAAQEIQLTQEEMALISTLERNGREVDPDQLAPIWD